MVPVPPPDAAERSFRDAMSRLAGGVAVVTALDPVGRDCALTVTSVASVSLSPPLVLVSVGRDGFMHDALVVSDGWNLSMLNDGQRDLAAYAARHRGPGDRDDLTPWSSSVSVRTGARVLDDVVSAVECVTEQVVDAGDHALVIGRVVAVATAPVGARSGLVHVDREYRRLGPVVPPS